MKIAYQGIAGSYSESCAKEKYPNCETISCKTFDECFEKSNRNNNIKTLIPESNNTTGNIGVEYLIFKYRLNVYAEHFYPIKHNLFKSFSQNLIGLIFKLNRFRTIKTFNDLLLVIDSCIFNTI